MTLGDILESGEGVAIVGRPVEFWVAQKAKRFLVKGLLHPVSEAARQEAKRTALAWLRQQPEYKKRKDETGVSYDPEIPLLVVREEAQYRFLQQALRNPDDPTVLLIPNSHFAEFRDGVVVEQVNWLDREYNQLIRDEYPEIATEEQREDLEQQAAGK